MSAAAPLPGRSLVEETTRRKIAADAVAIVGEWARARSLAVEQCCLQVAAVGAVLLGWVGLDPRRLLLQGGSARWPRLRVEDDDGVVATHFSYESDSNVAGAAIRRVAAGGGLGDVEGHYWLVWRAPDDGYEVVDFSTGWLRAQCSALTGLAWTAPDPPPFFWGRALPDRWSYEANAGATALGVYLCGGWPARTLAQVLG